MVAKGVILVLSCLGVIQALFLCVYLFSLRDRRSNLLLAFLLLSLTVRIGKSVVYVYLDLDPRIRNLAIATVLATGPLLWLYGKALLERQAFSPRRYLHLGPFALYALLSPIIPNDGSLLSRILYPCVLLHQTAYLILSWYYLFNVPAGTRLKSWYRNIVTGVSIVLLVYGGVYLGWIPFYILGAVFFSLLVYIFSYMLLKRHVFALEKYTSSAIDSASARRLVGQVKDLFEQQAAYLDRELTLKRAAAQLSVNARDLSQAINEQEGKNFAEFVNHYRIAKAKTMLADSAYAHEKVASIAYDCGFGTVTSFNVAFKAATQMTPTQYREQFALIK
ncbi:helix-turn-helix domain-containing protein [Dawidia soli]|uniref:AraC family transcriptional regulator n=1 Tax=Dawidia soli TaxID=2782352 RepID=A0AAP2D802_9BACT|nr:AraC family transcriptional regulator [Dawidia soli]MBT1687166.1 AraC family transcriptional regulator [Dawidia soli]